MMNYYYPFPCDPFDHGYGGHPADAEAASIALIDLPLCLVRIDGEYGDDVWALALTGGGMDLSPQIVDAFAALGFAPPAFLTLPRYAGTEWTARTRRRVAAMRATHRAMLHRATRALADLDEYAAWARENTREHRARRHSQKIDERNGAPKEG